MTTIALASGYISQNVGNAFFELGASALLRRAVGKENVYLIQDVPANWTLWRKSKGIQGNWWNVLERLDVDAFVFEGPTLTENFEVVWDEILGSLRRANIEPIMLSIGFSRYTEEERTQAVRVIRRHGLSTIFTRDERTFDMLDAVHPTYSGIDSAFFMPWAYTPPKLTGEKYVVSCFEAQSEPIDVIADLLDEPRVKVDKDASFFSSLKDRVASLGHSSAYASQIVRTPSLIGRIGSFEIVRPVHRTNPAVHARMFKDANSIASDEPFTYLTVYSNGEFTVTDRVHAMVATLAYGRPALLISDTPRRSLLERIGASFPMTGLFTVNQDVLEKERLKELDALKSRLG